MGDNSSGKEVFASPCPSPPGLPVLTSKLGLKIQEWALITLKWCYFPYAITNFQKSETVKSSSGLDSKSNRHEHQSNTGRGFEHPTLERQTCPKRSRGRCARRQLKVAVGILPSPKASLPGAGDRPGSARLTAFNHQAFRATPAKRVGHTTLAQAWQWECFAVLYVTYFFTSPVLVNMSFPHFQNYFYFYYYG